MRTLVSETGMRSLRHSAWPLYAARRIARESPAKGLETGISILTHSTWPLSAAQHRACESRAFGRDDGIRSLTHSACPLLAAWRRACDALRRGSAPWARRSPTILASPAFANSMSRWEMSRVDGSAMAEWAIKVILASKRQAVKEHLIVARVIGNGRWLKRQKNNGRERPRADQAMSVVRWGCATSEMPVSPRAFRRLF